MQLDLMSWKMTVLKGIIGPVYDMQKAYNFTWP